jgi:hypothetical protein
MGASNVLSSPSLSGSNNIAIGNQTYQGLTTGNGNTSVGHTSGLNMTTGVANTSLGYQTLATNVTGTKNTAIGSRSLLSATGSNNTAIGSDTETGAFNNCIVIGQGAFATGSGQLVIGSAATPIVGLTNAPAAQTHYLPVTINGVAYRLLLTV